LKTCDNKKITIGIQDLSSV